ncbi:Uma2 family endonuclease [Anthocerotibacter panamensis]|uniref:Uma2 family endonuclease n=1 Tax=Anthocerotibacter panamensis TaxID=2857077 RepID=UPI001C4030E3|nr:Uma2 family endonuclease [Anthocerotibacter panamensis]
MTKALDRPYIITWEKLPANFPLPDDPVDNLDQPLLAMALTSALNQAGRTDASMLFSTNYGVCARVNDKTVVKAPDWMYVPAITVARTEVERSYTPHLEGSVPAVVMEFLSDTEGGEYSVKPVYPYGKWFFYEQILAVPVYVLFDLANGHLEVYQRQDRHYEACEPGAEGRFWIEPLGLWLGVWQGTWMNRTGLWLRWWDPASQLLYWGAEQAEQERQRAEQERQRAEQERQRAEQERQRAEQERFAREQAQQQLIRLTARLQELGIDLENP